MFYHKNSFVTENIFNFRYDNILLCPYFVNFVIDRSHYSSEDESKNPGNFPLIFFPLIFFFVKFSTKDFLNLKLLTSLVEKSGRR